MKSVKNDYEKVVRKVLSLVKGDQSFIETLSEAFEKAGYACSIKPIAVRSPLIPITAPRLWKDRSVRNGVSPVDFIRDNYKKALDAGVLARTDILDLDKTLYNAYAQWVKRHPEDVLIFAPGRPSGTPAIADPVEAIERIRANARAGIARRRATSASSTEPHTP